MFYKGFVRTKNKNCIDPYKNAELLKFEDVKNLDEYAGIIAADSILIDIDDMEQSNKLLNIVDDKQLNCRVYQSRSGMHFLFKNTAVKKCHTKTKLACGIVADVKSGFKNCYEVLKIEGKEREVLYDVEDGEPYQLLPKFLYPIKTSIDFLNLGDGDGRNQAFFNYELTLQSNDFSIEEARECIRIMNKYVIPEALDDDELETILRDEAFGKPVFFNGTAFLFDSFARYLRSEHHIKRVNGALQMYKDGIYIAGTADIEHAMIEHIPTLSSNRRNEVLKYLDVLIRDNSDVAPPEFIAFNNGIYNINTGELLPFTPDYIITNKIPWNYNSAAYCNSTDNVLHNISCGDDGIRAVLEEMIGYTMFRRNELGKAFILTGSGSNGKSTFLNMIKNMLGNQNISVLDMKKLGDRFSTIMLLNKLANIGDDISDEFLSDVSEFKKVTTGEMLDAEQKGQPKFQFSPYCKLMFSANSIPRIGKGRDSGAILRRLIIIPFNAKFDAEKDDFKPYISTELHTEESMEYLINLGVEGLKRVLASNKFTSSAGIKSELSDFEESNNPVIGFFHMIDYAEIDGRVTKDVYAEYQLYSAENGLNPISSGEFSKQVKRYYGVNVVNKSVNSKKCRVFKGSDEK